MLDQTMMMYRAETEDLQLDPERIIETVDALSDRIEGRFPGSGLGQLARRLHVISSTTVSRLERVMKPNIAIRAVSALLSLAFIGVVVSLVLFADFDSATPDFFELIQTIEAGSNELIFIGIAIFFLVTLENRLRRRNALNSIRELRALAHIVDMHQLTKDPDRVSQPGSGGEHGKEAIRSQLTRYLDYCSEMLALVSKIAAIYAQTFNDPVILQAVDEVESLTTGLSNKIWQKIIILDQMTLRSQLEDEARADRERKALS